jgi:hypothetical protein
MVKLGKPYNHLLIEIENLARKKRVLKTSF